MKHVQSAVEGKAGFGVVGCGSIAEIAHFPSIQRAEGARLVAVCDSDEEAAFEEIAAKGKITRPSDGQEAKAVVFYL